jgi:hypothetical protein
MIIQALRYKWPVGVKDKTPSSIINIPDGSPNLLVSQIAEICPTTHSSILGSAPSQTHRSTKSVLLKYLIESIMNDWALSALQGRFSAVMQESWKV